MTVLDQVGGRSPEHSKDRLRFNYDSVAPPVAKFLKGQAERICRHYATTIIQIGKALIGAKHYLPHGAFIVWVETEVGIPARTAQAYMRAAEWAANKSSAVANLSPSVIYLLSASSTPKEFMLDVLNRVEAGEQIVPAAIFGELRSWREAKRDGCDKEQRNGGSKDLSAAAETGDHDQNDQITVATAERKVAVERIVAILMRGLCAADFDRVRDIIMIMSSRDAVEDCDLARDLAVAFSNAKRPEAAHTMSSFISARTRFVLNSKTP
ncbi:MAG TPA: DUF3102 domain-containing protein [Bradyrhizobium sp.]|nr:DUF3102 domain-containing protein [Bradyrhizobium sp.]